MRAIVYEACTIYEAFQGQYLFQYYDSLRRSYFRYKETEIFRDWAICPSSQVLIYFVVSDSILSDHKLHALNHYAYVNSYSGMAGAQEQDW
jgi:hypothetical protein